MKLVGLTLVGAAAMALGCGHAPARIVSVDVDAWGNAQPPPGMSRTAADRYYLIRPRVQAVAEQQHINLVVARDLVLYAAPETDLTPTLLGHPNGAVRISDRAGVINVQRVIDQTRDGKQAHQALKVEFEGKVAVLDALQKALKDKYANDREALARSTEFADFKTRYEVMKRELEQHERAAVRALLERIKPEVAELARRRGIDVVMESSDKGQAVVFRGNVEYPVVAPDLTDELIRLHDGR